MQQLHAIEYPKMAAKIAQASASEPKAPWRYSGGIWTIKMAFWAHPRLMFELFQGARLLLFACCFPIACVLFLMRPLLRCSPSDLPGYEAQVTKAITS